MGPEGKGRVLDRTGSGSGAGGGDGNLSARVDVELQRERCERWEGWGGGGEGRVATRGAGASTGWMAPRVLLKTSLFTRGDGRPARAEEDAPERRGRRRRRWRDRGWSREVVPGGRWTYEGVRASRRASPLAPATNALFSSPDAESEFGPVVRPTAPTEPVKGVPPSSPDRHTARAVPRATR